MKCLVTGSNVKVLGKAVHSLSRIGDELYLEPLEDGLSLRTVNSSRSAYACFLFAPLFFQQYQAATPGQDPLRCKILMKDCESLQAVFDPAVCPHVLCAPARVLGEAVLPFPPALAEVTLGIGRGHRVILRSYQEEAGEGTRRGLGQGAEVGWAGAWPGFPPVADPTDSAAKAMVTEMSIGGEDFQQLQAQEGVAITFCLKEFRGLLSFAESANLSLSIYFDGPGRPAIFAIKDSLLDGHFVLATLSEPDLCAPELQRPVPQLQAHSTPHLDDFALDDIDSYMIAMETTVGSEGSRTLPSTSPSPGLQPHRSPGSHSEEEDDTEPSTVPGTPPPKKFRSLFFGSVLAPAHSPQGPSPVLAEDSEGEG
nr:cell cycle checkpoint control protein RAD9A isoform X6 [Kogia breviceps]